MTTDVNLILIAAEGHDDAQVDIIDAIYAANGIKPPSLRREELRQTNKRMTSDAFKAFAQRHNAAFKAATRRRASKHGQSAPAKGIPSGGRPPRPTQRRRTEP